jgi:hypothetical protein
MPYIYFTSEDLHQRQVKLCKNRYRSREATETQPVLKRVGKPDFAVTVKVVTTTD